MNDQEKIEALKALLDKHQEGIENNERPFNESGELVEALYSLVNDNKDRLIQVGWLER